MNQCDTFPLRHVHKPYHVIHHRRESKMVLVSEISYQNLSIHFTLSGSNDEPMV